MKETNLRPENFLIYIKKAAEFIPGLNFNAGTVKIVVLFDLFSNFLD